MTRNVPTELLEANHPILRWLLIAAAVAYGIAFVAAVLRVGAARWILAAGAALHIAGMTGRGIAIGFFPLTNKMVLNKKADPLKFWLPTTGDQCELERRRGAGDVRFKPRTDPIGVDALHSATR